MLGVLVQTKVTLTELRGERDNVPKSDLIPLNVLSARRYGRPRLPPLAFPSPFANALAAV
jgi:hypothetical protein